MTVTPAYGRDYKSLKAAKVDWAQGKDFIVADFYSEWDGRYINEEQAVGQSIMVRYSNLRKVGKLQ